MSSLYRRASGPQSRMLKIISGAVMNAAHAHRMASIDERFARSASKRAVGTISAQWRELLATPQASSRADVRDCNRVHNEAKHIKPRGGRRAGGADPRISRVIREVSRLIRPARDAGHQERAAALVEVMKIIAKISAEYEASK